MIRIYLIMPDYLDEFKSLIEMFKDQNNKNIFEVTGVSSDIKSFHRGFSKREDLDAAVILSILEFLDQESLDCINELTEKFKDNEFYFIHNENNRHAKSLEKKNSHILAKYRESQPIAIHDLMRAFVAALNNGGQVVASASTSTKKKTQGKVTPPKLFKNYEVGLLGIDRGVGVTHTGIMMAKALSSQHKVAFVEANDHDHLSRLLGDKKGDVKRYNNIDFYYDIEYVNFSKKYKDNYDIIIIDYGCDEDIYDIEDFVRNNKCCVVAHGSDWKIDDLRNYIKMAKEHDPLNKWHYLIPFTTYKGDIEEFLDHKYAFIPYNMNPFKTDEEFKDLCYKIID